MNKLFRLPTFAAVAYALTLSSPVASVRGQTKARDYVLAVSDVLWSPGGNHKTNAIAMIIRDLRASNDVVILRSSNADAISLAVALDALDDARQQPAIDATRPLAVAMVEPEGSGPIQHKMSGVRRAQLEAMLNEVAQQPVSGIGTFGRGRWRLFHSNN
jgi:hypothetical protein